MLPGGVSGATAVGGTHPTGMHSCHMVGWCNIVQNRMLYMYQCNILNFHFHFHSPFVYVSFVLENGGISEWYTGVVHKTESGYYHLKHIGRHHFQSE